MNSGISQMTILPVGESSSDTYIDIGIRSYHQHYLHLWPNSDPSPYIEDNYTSEIVHKELADPNLKHYLIEYKAVPAGIFKIVLNAAIGHHAAKDALLIEKIYFLREYSGHGLGKACLKYVVEMARVAGKKVVWLDTMKRGPALAFYQKFGFEILGERKLRYEGALEDQKDMLILQYLL